MSDQDNLETTPKEIKKAVKKKFLIRKSLKKEKEFDFSKYGVRRQARIYAMFALYSYDVNKDIQAENDKNYDIKDFDYKEMSMDENAFPFAREILTGTIKNIDTVDNVIEKYSQNWDIKRIQYVDRAIIRISIYSLLFNKTIPKSVIIDEAIEIAKIFSSKDSYKFINGILDRVNIENINSNETNLDDVNPDIIKEEDTLDIIK